MRAGRDSIFALYNINANLSHVNLRAYVAVFASSAVIIMSPGGACALCMVAATTRRTSPGVIFILHRSRPVSSEMLYISLIPAGRAHAGAIMCASKYNVIMTIGILCG